MQIRSLPVVGRGRSAARPAAARSYMVRRRSQLPYMLGVAVLMMLPLLITALIAWRGAQEA